MTDETPPSPVSALRKAVEVAGGYSALARICGCTPPNIHQLVQRGSVLPAAYVFDVEEATGISRHDLRPDIYPREETGNDMEGVAA